MAPATDFKVIIVGGGVAGLTLANMLEKFDIDYVVLEAHGDIAPQVGASIGMFPNGLRILDQMGIHDQILAIFKNHIPYDKTHSRSSDGKIIATVHGIHDQFVRRHGYGLLFFDRQALLKILYDHVQDKTKILTGRKFESAELDDGGVTATCVDGSTFRGTLLVGADGIHSKVRSVMKSWGAKLEPGFFDEKEESRVPCYYRCSFGIAIDVPNWVSGEQHIVTGNAKSQLVISGPDNRVYWFMFERLPEVLYGDDIPKYTTKDEEEFVKRNANVPITESVTFGQVFASRFSSALTPLHEVVYEKWFFRRFITLGDSAHKPNPIGGQGGNGAIESCAELVDALLEKKKSRGDTLDNLTTKEVVEVFEKTQSARHERAKDVVHASHMQQCINSYANPVLSAITWGILVPLSGPEQVVTLMTKSVPGATRLRCLPIPQRPRVIPYIDELPSLPFGKTISSIICGGQVVSMCALVAISTTVFRDQISEVAKWAVEAPIIVGWFGQVKAPEAFNLFESAMTSPCSDSGTKLQLINFLFQLISPLLIYTVEAHRVGNQGTPLTLDLLFTCAMQVYGIGRVSPIHAALHALCSHELPTGRSLPIVTAKSLIPAITLAYVIPTIMVFANSPNTWAWQHALSFWQFAPPAFTLLTRLISFATKKYQRKNQKQEDPNDLERYMNKDVPILKSAYTFAFATQATAHIASMVHAWSRPDVSLFKTFVQVPNGPLNGPFRDWNLPSISPKLGVFCNWEMLLFSASALASGLYSIWDLRRLGYIQTRDALTAVVGSVAGQFLVGPGATWAGLWYWRESRLASLMTRCQGDKSISQ